MAQVAFTRAGAIGIRPLRPGDTETVRAVFAQLSPRSRRLRFGAAKPELSPHEAALLAAVDTKHHVLIAWRGGLPIGHAQYARDESEPTLAEVAVAVADAWQG